MTNASDTPSEAFERSYPMRALRYRLRRGSGGAGAAPGGEGPGGDEAARVPLPDKVTVRLAAGDAVQILTPGGGGWGAPG